MDIAKFVADAPPGETDAVRRDIEIITNNSNAVSREIASELATVNVEKLRPVTVGKHLAVVSKYNQLSENTFRSEDTVFEIDHATGTTKVLNDEVEPLSKAGRKLQVALDAYVEDHYPLSPQEGRVAEVFDYKDDLAVVIVGRRLSPSNFHNGQWTSHYVVSEDSIKGKIDVDVHFFEDGNVRLKSNTTVDASGDVIDAIKEAENNFETQLHRSLQTLNETEFKALRRALPVTRERMDWSTTAAQLKLGRELGA